MNPSPLTPHPSPPPQVSMYPTQCAPWLLVPDSLAVVNSALSGEHLQVDLGFRT